MCPICNSFLSAKYIWRHKQLCAEKNNLRDEQLPIQSVPVSTLITFTATDESDEFKKEVVSHFREDELGQICMNDVMINEIGKDLWDRNVKGERKSVMASMRRLARLVHECRRTTNPFNGADIYKPDNFDIVTKALERISGEGDGDGKHSFRVGITNILKSSFPIVRVYYLVKGDMDNAEKTKIFGDILTVKWKPLANRARYVIHRRKQEQLRQPAELPSEEDVKLVRNYIAGRMQILLDEDTWCEKRYNELRTLLLTRLTLWNGRRGNEPARLTLDDWKRLVGDVWIDQQRKEHLTLMEKHTMGKWKLAYVAGKGVKDVPVMVPLDIFAAVQKLISVRIEVGINSANKYIFAAGHNSRGYALGSQAIQRVCKAAGITGTLTATSNRRRVSTLIALLTLSDRERETVYRHFGHSEWMNQNVYQSPEGIQEVLTMGQCLEKLDESKYT